ncbi:GntR family transcriptional regulator [Sphingomonas sp. Leaf33]|uniref:GntR family transcriptional regulator n=1 Tax=Sphingomonas sp. Leaf33 TaxID=1736215 RepID=UPI0006F29F23|nr:GntR family transcriptional regulator [Sphingomonas sp. Leaf33]KQN25619.1 GntR family transcriptional regulator [Sphingomonas sp. Leaf33]
MSLVVRTLSDRLVDIVRDRILDGTLRSDVAIRQDALAAELGVSKIPLREALTRLEQEGLVRSQANHGYFVRDLSAGEAEEVFALRLKIEPEAVAIAATRATDHDHRRAALALADLDTKIDRHDIHVGAANRAFHIALIRPAGRAITLQLLERLHVLSERYVGKHLEPTGRDARANDEHADLLDAWRSRDVDRLHRDMHAHIETTLIDLRRQLTPDDGAGSQR